MPRVVGVVPVVPSGVALWPLRGLPLYEHAVDSLVRSGAVSTVVIAVSHGLAEPVHGPVVKAPADDVLDVLGLVLPSLLHGAAPADIVVMHDPAHALARPGLVADVVQALASADAGTGGAIAAGPVTDTLKRVDADGVVLATVDRERFRTLRTPQAYRSGVLAAVVRPAAVRRSPTMPLAASLVHAAHASGVRLTSVPAPPDVVAVSSLTDLEVAAAAAQ